MQREDIAVVVFKEVTLIKGISPLDKMVLSKIISLDNEDNCYASNRYIGDCLGVEPVSVSRSVSRLFKKKLIVVSILRNNERTIKRSSLTAHIGLLRQPIQNDNGGIPNGNTPINGMYIPPPLSDKQL